MRRKTTEELLFGAAVASPTHYMNPHIETAIETVPYLPPCKSSGNGGMNGGVFGAYVMLQKVPEEVSASPREFDYLTKVYYLLELCPKL